MVGIQAGIGAVNDIVDAKRDEGTKPAKPLPRGILSVTDAWAVAITAAAAGLALSLPSGPLAAIVALAGLGVGLLYDLGLKGTAWSWLPFALGIPLLPLYAWLGATGGAPMSLGLLVAAAFVAGAALAIVNAIADVERDRAAGVESVAVALGPRLAWRIHAILLVVVFGVAFVSLGLAHPAGLLPVGWGLLLVALGGLIVAVGSRLALSREPERRERGWELEAVGIGLGAIGWIGGFVGPG
jgi:4-hydroxybenzoate polyprenyltransferase